VLTGGGGAPARRRKTPKSEDEKAEGALDFDVEEEEEEEEEDGGEDEKSTKFGGGDTKFIHPHDLCFIFFLPSGRPILCACDCGETVKSPDKHRCMGCHRSFFANHCFSDHNATETGNSGWCVNCEKPRKKGTKRPKKGDEGGGN